MPGVVVVGAGPGIGTSVARRFAQAGLAVGLIARTSETLNAAARVLTPFAASVSVRQADVADAGALKEALRGLVAEMGVPDVLVYNAAVIRYDAPGELSNWELIDTWAVNVGGAMTTAAEILPQMAGRHSGTMILTGGMPTPVPALASLSLGKAGLRTLTELLAAQYGERGVHVATVTIFGAVAPGTDFDPDDIAQEYWALSQESRDMWRHQVDYKGVGTPVWD